MDRHMEQRIKQEHLSLKINSGRFIPKFRNYRNNPYDHYSLSSNNIVQAIFEDSDSGSSGSAPGPD